jgi:hypothetical protein
MSSWYTTVSPYYYDNPILKEKFLVMLLSSGSSHSKSNIQVKNDLFNKGLSKYIVNNQIIRKSNIFISDVLTNMNMFIKTKDEAL